MQSQVEDLVIRAYDVERDLSNGYIIYRGGVEAQLGPTKIYTDTLIVRDAPDGTKPVSVTDGAATYSLANHEAKAVGAVRLVDPDGIIEASDLWVTWEKDLPNGAATARAKGFKLSIGSLRLEAEEATRMGARWDLARVRGTTDKGSRPLYAISMDHLILDPGKSGKGKGVTMSLLGNKLPKIPSMSFSLDRRARATRIPQLSYRQRDGFGIAWDGNFLSGDQRLLTTSISSFPKLPPTFVTTYSFSRVPYEKSVANQFQVQSDLADRSPFSYFANIYMSDIEAQSEMMGAQRDTFQIATTFNVSTFGRKSDLQKLYSKPIEAIHEKSGKVGSSAYMTQWRAGFFQEGGEKPISRATFTAAISPPTRQTGRLISGIRFDGGAHIDAGGYSWLGGEAGMSYEPKENFRLSAGVYGYHSFGRPLYDADLFTSNQGLALRGDIYGKATKVSLLWRYDPSQGWFDRQFRISQVMGPVEPVIIYRQNPNEYQFGLRFRIDQLVDLLQNRSIGRGQKPTKIRP